MENKPQSEPTKPIEEPQKSKDQPVESKEELAELFDKALNISDKQEKGDATEEEKKAESDEDDFQFLNEDESTQGKAVINEQDRNTSQQIKDEKTGKMKTVIPVKKSLVENIRNVDIAQLDWKVAEDWSSICLNESKIEVVQNDITQEDSDAITNAANSQLMHGGGVAGAIARKGGKAINQESREYVDKNGDIMVGACGHTTAGDLPSKWVIHTVGPMYRNYTPEVNNLLK